MKKIAIIIVVVLALGAALVYFLFGKDYRDRVASLKSCKELVEEGFRPIADSPTDRFTGKVQEYTARCRGGEKALRYRHTPWVDWSNYYGTGGPSSLAREATGIESHLKANSRGIDGALLDLEYQRIELIRFNLFDNEGTFEEYVKGRLGTEGPVLKRWDSMRLPKDHPRYKDVGGDGLQQCKGDLIRWRTLTGICNDVINPRMGATGTKFARNVAFEETYPEKGNTELVRNRHGDRLGLLKPDPQVISRKLFTRQQSRPDQCREGQGLDGSNPDSHCDYQKAPFFNVLAAFWIQFMTHDWFSHLEEGQNSPQYMPVGCSHKIVGGKEVPLTPEEIKELGCRPDDSMERALMADTTPSESFEHQGRRYDKRAPKTTRNQVTAWWDASQIYGYDATSLKRVKLDPKDPAKLQTVQVGDGGGAGEKQGYLPLFQAADPINPAWAGQEATAFPDNWNIGLSFYHNLFTREHNNFVEAFRAYARENPAADCGLRNPARPDQVIRYRDISDKELFQAARLVVSAMIAKIHTIEWTTQLLYNEPLFRGMNANWNGLFGEGSRVSEIVAQIATATAKANDKDLGTTWYSVLASGAGIIGLGADAKGYDMTDPKFIMAGVNHFGSPFNFPEEFPTVYRLHPLVPDLLEMRDWDDQPNRIKTRLPVVESFRKGATPMMRTYGLPDFALSMGRQRLGLLALQNHPLFLQNLPMQRLKNATGKLDVAALDVIRDREHGVPRFNEFRRQLGLKTLTGFADFVDVRLESGSPARREQERLAGLLREVYGTHVCDDSKVISEVQLMDDGRPVTDCLGHPDGSTVDNIEDVDVVVGMLSETTRPHGFAISETQFHLFILNASRRLFSDRFFTSSFRPEFYSSFGLDWVNNNGPTGKRYEPKESNGHKVEVSPLKRVLLRAMPELEGELKQVVNAFDPWARDRGEYYSLEWKPRPGAESDEAFKL